MDLNLRPVNNHLFLRDIDLHSIGAEYGSPAFLYDLRHVQDQISIVKGSLKDAIDLYYCVKANPNLELLKGIMPLVDGMDISSGGELREVLRTGSNPSQISFAGPGKTDEELSLAISKNVGSISVESLNELKRIERIAKELGKTADVSMRINPAKVNRKFPIKMGGKASQLGIDQEKCQDFFGLLQSTQRCNFIGIHVFSGTQCLSEEIIIENAQNILQLARLVFKATGIPLKKVNLGGGFGIPYFRSQKEIDVKYVCASLVEQFNQFRQETGLFDCTGIIELGRFIVAQAGIYIARVVDIKESRGKHFCVLDGGMNHHLAASGKFGQLMRENFKMVNLSNTDESKKMEVAVVGPLCAAFDLLGLAVELVEPQIGDYIAILNSGAYVYTGSPLLFLSHDLPAELLIDGGEVKIARRSFKPEMFY
ncbi:pyridoxal-dependent decarboxylase, exosortase A system-associated [Candidatus Omnitrophota bacterium]